MSRNDKGPKERNQEDIRLIEEAQKKLTYTNGVDADQAYRVLQVKSMERGVSMVEVAKEVLEGGDEYFF